MSFAFAVTLSSIVIITVVSTIIIELKTED